MDRFGVIAAEIVMRKEHNSIDGGLHLTEEFGPIINGCLQGDPRLRPRIGVARNQLKATVAPDDPLDRVESRM
jgi:hypothetical protein